jgi:nitroreductase
MPLLIDRERLETMARVIATRRSVRRYAPQSLAREIVAELLRCAGNAPSAHNRQPWRFAVLQASGPRRLAEVQSAARRPAEGMAIRRNRDLGRQAFVRADNQRPGHRCRQHGQRVDRCRCRQQQAEYLMAVRAPWRSRTCCSLLTPPASLDADVRAVLPRWWGRS